MKKSFFQILYIQVLAAIFSGVMIGMFYPEFGVSLKPLGDGFIKLIKMMIAPVIFCTMVSGIAGMQDMKKVGSVGTKAFLYFEVISTLALAIGLIVANILKPGAGFNANPATLHSPSIAEYTAKAKSQTLTDFILNIIPNTVTDAFAKGDILQVLLVSLLFGVALSKLGTRVKPVTDFIQYLAEIVFEIITLIMKLAPIGALGAMAFTIGKYGIASLLPLAKLMGSFYLSCTIFIFILLGSISKLGGFSLWKLLKYIKEELFVVLGTSSSESALPLLMYKLEKLGCSKPVVGLVLPIGYSFNLDGTNIYMTMAALFIAQATNTELSLSQQLTILLVAMLSSKGASGVTGAGFITLAATLAVVPAVPVAGMALILGIDRFMSEARALTNMIGNSVATIIISKWENELDTSRLHQELHTPSPNTLRL